jgi:hypothetical protein
MFQNMGFGALPLDQEYIRVEIPADVLAFDAGSYVNGKWNVQLPTGKLVDEYEAKMKWVIDQIFDNYNNFKPGDVTYSYASDVSRDISFFKRYMQVKKQVEQGWMTPQSTDWFYKTYFGSFENYRVLSEWISSQASEALQEMMDRGMLMLADAKSKMTQEKMNTYTNVIVPIANNFSSDDQKFIREVFVLKMDGSVTLDELVRVMKIVVPHMTMAQYVKFYMFAYQMILGPNLSTNVLNTDSDLPYYGRNIPAELQEITAKYTAVANRIGEYLDPETGALFQERLKIHELAYREPNNPKYYVCGEVCNRIMENFRSPIEFVLDEGLKLTKDYYEQTGETRPLVPQESAEDIIRRTVAASGGTEDDVQNLIKSAGIDLNNVQTMSPEIQIDEETVEEAKSAVPLVLGLGLILFLLFGRKDN